MARSPDFGWGDLSRVHLPDPPRGTVPDPFHDETGFPVALLHVRQEIQHRGGEITLTPDNWVVSRGGECWTATHPDPDTPNVCIGFFPDGYTTVSVTEHAAVENSPEWSYQVDPSTGRILLQRLILGVVNGGYSETVTFNGHGQWIKASCAIDYEGQDVGSGRNPDATGEPVHEVKYTYPAWPSSGETAG